MDFLVLIVLGYLVGSLSPGYFLGRIIKHIDIRKFGNFNTGATNTYRIVGPIYGILAGISDFLKSVLIYFLAVSGTFPFTGKINPELAILGGLAATLGHIKPFYLQFRGGGGVATLFGLCTITIFYTRSIFALILMIATIVYSITISKSLQFTHPLRRALKLLALVLPFAMIWLPKNYVLAGIFVILIIFAFFDLIRFLKPKINQKYLAWVIFAKQKEKNRPSGATLFLSSSFLSFWLFPKEIAVLSLICFILGDSLASLGNRILPIPLLSGKTVGGALIIIAVSAVAGLFLNSLTPLTLAPSLILITPLIVALLDQFSFLMDDNLLVPLGTTLVLSVLRNT